MTTATVVRYDTRTDSADHNQELIEKVFAELDDELPAGLRYASFRLGGGTGFLHLAISEGDSPLTKSPAFAWFQDGLGDRLLAPVARTEATLIGSYRFVVPQGQAR